MPKPYMGFGFNHTIVWARGSEASAAFLSEILGLPGALRPTPLRNSDRHDGFEM
jgi:hypothetical protein